MNHFIRLATMSDGEAILKIYAPYIRDTAVTFETEVPAVSEFSYRIESICKQYPYLVYLIDNEIVGYAYASKHRERAAYIYDVDVSIYVLPKYHGSRAAYKLYDCLFKILKELGYYNAYAGYTVPNNKSMIFHQKFGFTFIGTYHKTGYKFGKWHDVAWLEKIINEHAEKPETLKSLSDLPDEYLNNFFEISCGAGNKVVNEKLGRYEKLVDNKTAHASAEYDEKILSTIPFYNLFHQLAIELVQSINKSPDKWLDTGCGTGNLYIKAKSLFPEAYFVLADPSEKMLEMAKSKIQADTKLSFVLQDSQSLDYDDNSFDVITAIQCHHYLDTSDRKKAVQNCFRMLKPGGVFIGYENIEPLSKDGLLIALKMWETYQISWGKMPAEAKEHIDRYGKEYFPISIKQHIQLLNEAGFNIVEILWASYMQAGFYAIK